MNHLKSSAEPEKPPQEKEITWTKAENQRFIEGVRRDGKQWIKVQQYVKTKDISEVRKAAQKLMKDIENNPKGELAAEFSHLFKVESSGSDDDEMDSDWW